MSPVAAAAQTDVEEEQPEVQEEQPLIEPPFGTPEWILYWGELEGHLPTPIEVSITGSIPYKCPPLDWYNFDVFPHKIKVTNTGYTLLLGAKWMTERPYLLGGPFLEKMIFSQIHYHWGADLMEGSDHTVDKRRHPGEMQATFFKSEYMTQEEALRHKDGVVVFCYLIRDDWTEESSGFNGYQGFSTIFQCPEIWYFSINRETIIKMHGVNPDIRLQRVIDAFPRITEGQSHTRIGPYPMYQLMPLFFEDYFVYWGTLEGPHGSFVVRHLVARAPLFATLEQMKAFRTLGDSWDEPNLRNFRLLQEREDRHIFYINPHWNQYNSLLPIPRIPEASISVLSPDYRMNTWMLPPQNAYMIPRKSEET